MRRWLACFVAIGLLLSCSAAFADGLPLAAEPALNRLFERYQNFKQQADGAWSAYDRQAAQLRRTVSEGAARSYMGKGALILYPSVRGNAALGLTEIVLNVCLLKSVPLGADSLSITVDGDTRYDFIAEAKREKIGAYACERFELPLDAQGLAMLQSIGQQGCSISIYGGTKAYKTTIVVGDKLPAKETFEMSSLEVIRAFLSAYLPVFARYDLWNLNAGLWADARPEMSVARLDGDVYGEDLPKFDASQQLVIDDRTAITRMQQLLKGGFFYAGKVDGKYGANARAAIREAQQYYGLLPTGQADRTLIECLLTGEARAAEAALPVEDYELLASGNSVSDAMPGTWYRLEDVAEIQLSRYWLAQKLTPTSGSAQLSPAIAAPSPQPTATPSPAADASITPKNRSNRLLICDGQIVNLTDSDLFLPMTAQATIVLGGQFTYTCAVRCEQSDATAFGTMLLPGESARLLLYSEIPDGLVDGSSMEVRLNLTTPNGTMELVY